MADTDYSKFLDESLSPLAAAGMDPDEARANPAAAIAKLRGDQPDASAQNSWASQAQQVASAQPPATPSTVSPGSAPAAVTRSGDPRSSDAGAEIMKQGVDALTRAN